MISILLAVYNGEKYIRECIDSILNQTFTDFELLIGLNACTDDTLKIVESFDDPRVRIFIYLDKSKSKTLNKLIKESKYDYVAIQDCDDIWHPDKLKIQSNYLLDYDIVGTFCKYINANGDVIGQPSLYTDPNSIRLLTFSGNNQIVNMSAIFSKSDICLWDESLQGVEDYDFWLNLMSNGYVAYNIPEYLVYHRIHTDSNFNTKDHSSTINMIMKRYVGKY